MVSLLAAARMRGHTEWKRSLTAPLRSFLRTESGSSGVLLAAIVAALAWSNVDGSSYRRVWHSELAFRLGGHEVGHSLQDWINDGLMALFFLVVGLEARREFDLGDLRERSRSAVPLAAGLAGMLLPVLIYLGVNAGGSGAHGWGVAMSTDTALALGLLAALGRDVPERVRVFVLTLCIGDDVLALIVIAVVYSDSIHLVPLSVALAALAALIAFRMAHVRSGPVCAVIGIVMWAALFSSGVDPVVAGLIVGLSTPAYSPARGDLDLATGLFRSFREQPTPELARTASAGLKATLSPNERLQNLLHPWTSYLIVPLFGLVNAGIAIDGHFLVHAYTSPITLGVAIGYVVGKPVAVFGTSWAMTRMTHGRLQPPVGRAAVLGSGTMAGVGFTVSILIASLAFDGTELDEAKLGVLTAAVCASLTTWLVFRLTGRLSPERRVRALLGESEVLTDLVLDVDGDRDHVRGPDAATVTIVEYGDFECPFCGQAEVAMRELLTDSNVRYVWRHLPLTDVHPHAQVAAEAAEAAATQDAFWPMHDLLLANQERLQLPHLLDYARRLELDIDAFRAELISHVHAVKVAEDVESADLSGVSGTPTLFINGQRHYGAYDLDTLTAAVRTAHARSAMVNS